MLSKYFLLLAALFFSLLCGCQSTLETAEQIKSVNQTLQNTSNLELVVMSVESKQMIIAASDPSFETMSSDQKKSKAQSLAQVALSNWTSEWPISEVTVNFTAKEISEGYSDSFKFEPKDIQAIPTLTPSALPTVAESPPKPGES